MRTYGQYCGLAKALDVIGDRWSLLIVRELLMRGGCRYTDLQYGLPGVATNLLVTRLKELEEAGILTREEAPAPVATTLYHLTERGRKLEPAIRALGAWGAPMLAECPGKGDMFRAHWLEFALTPYVKDATPNQPPVSIELHVAEEPVTVNLARGKVSVTVKPAEDPDAVVSGSPRAVIRMLRGMISLAEAKAAGVTIKGNAKALKRLVTS